MRTAGLKHQLAVAALILITVATVFVRFRLAPMPLERDEGEYAYMGQLLLRGVPPFRDAYNMKFPGTYYAFSIIEALFGQTDFGIRLGLTAVVLGTAVGLFLLAKRWRDAATAYWAAAIYLVLSLSPGVFGFEAHATHFVSLAAVWGFWLLLAARDRKSNPGFLAAGVCFGLATLAKQHGAVFIAAGLVTVWLLAREDGWPRRVAARRMALLAAGAAIPLLLTAFTLWWTGVWPRFFFWTFQYALHYSSSASASTRLTFLSDTLKGSLFEFPLWLLGFAGAVALCARSRQASLWPLIWLIAALVQILPGFYFRPHYFIPMLPPLALLAGYIATQGHPENDKWRPLAGPALASVLCLLSLAAHREIFFQLSPDAVSRQLYGFNPFPECRAIGAYLEKMTQPSDTIAVVGSEPQIYFYSRRQSATGYLYTYSLVERQPYASAMQRDMAAEIVKNKPKYIVFVVVPMSWLGAKEADPYLLNWFQKYREGYTMAGLVALHPGRTDFVWTDPQSYRDPTDYYLTIWRRNSP